MSVIFSHCLLYCPNSTSGVGGTILTNGHPRNMHLFNKLTSYIMQEDLLRPNLTVYESMLIAAHLKLGNELLLEDKVQAVRKYHNDNYYYEYYSHRGDLSVSRVFFAQ